MREFGHERIAFISTVDADGPYREGAEVGSSQISERLAGMGRAFQEAGLSLPDDLIRLNAGNAESIKRVTRDVLDGPAPATAVVASDGLVGLSVVEGIQEMGKQMPSDISFLMYDNFAWTKLTTPPLTVIAQPVYDMGASAARILIRHIRQPGAAAAPPAEFTASLTVRGSIGAPAPATPPGAMTVRS